MLLFPGSLTVYPEQSNILSAGPLLTRIEEVSSSWQAEGLVHEAKVLDAPARILDAVLIRRFSRLGGTRCNAGGCQPQTKCDWELESLFPCRSNFD